MTQTPDETVLEMSIEELYAQIGETLIPGAGVLPDKAQRAARAGRAWLDMRSSELRSLVCPRVEVLIDEAHDDDATLAAAVADLIASATGQIPAFTAAVLMVRIGLRGFCQS